MTSTRQESLIDIQVLFDLEPIQRFNFILSVIDFHPILDVVMNNPVLVLNNH
ncbi:hypothetical protein [Sporosarcina sp. P34]|uniref:hypothetical protein n=1 Tax=Sporosarcina sp. P34 TaxID=2048247 RepID=UPI0013043359|nr:hypothetical protein [Sporosarcina sp. P34]